MSFLRILVFAALAFVVYNLLRRATLAMRPPSPDAPDERLNQLEPCAHCGVYVDAGEALSRRVHGQKRLYCSDTCLQAAEAGEAAKDKAQGAGDP